MRIPTEIAQCLLNHVIVTNHFAAQELSSQTKCEGILQNPETMVVDIG